MIGGEINLINTIFQNLPNPGKGETLQGADTKYNENVSTRTDATLHSLGQNILHLYR